MADAPKKTHTLTLGKHSEEVTEAELAATKKTLGDRRFAEYTVTPIQPAKPADVPSTPAKLKAADKPE